MKCAEVIEWMHRYLDHDLNREEITEMFRHIDGCLSCAEIFDRLTLLSEQLEQLPDVKAPFSLVDSILPALDELDRGLLESGKEERVEQGVIPFTREASRGKRQKSSSLGRRTGIGAVAAALILTIAIFNMPKEMPGAQVEDLMKSNSATSMDSNNSEAAPLMNTEAADTANSKDAAMDSGTQPESSDTSMFEATTAESPGPTMGDMDAADSSKDQTPSDVPAAKDNPTEKLSTGSQKPKLGVTATPDASELRSSKMGELDKNSPGNNSDTTSDSDLMQSMTIPDQGIMSLLPSSNATDELSWTTSDGQYTATVEGQQLVIYSIPPSGIVIDKLPLATLPLVGKWVTGEWAADSQQFNYVTDNNGKVVENVYVVPDLGTSDPLPKGTQSGTPTNSATNAPSATSSTK